MLARGFLMARCFIGINFGAIIHVYFRRWLQRAPFHLSLMDSPKASNESSKHKIKLLLQVSSYFVNKQWVAPHAFISLWWFFPRNKILIHLMWKSQGIWIMSALLGNVIWFGLSFSRRMQLETAGGQQAVTMVSKRAAGHKFLFH